MEHDLALFVGPRLSLRPFLEVMRDVRAYTLTPDSDLAVVPLDAPLEDALHRRFGTGDWPDGQALRLSTTVQTFAAECATLAPLAYIETHDLGDARQQSAVLWQSGRAVIGPSMLDLKGPGRQRPPSLWPINVVLRALGVRALAGGDEVAAFGLGNFRDAAAITATAWPFRL